MVSNNLIYSLRKIDIESVNHLDSSWCKENVKAKLNRTCKNPDTAKFIRTLIRKELRTIIDKSKAINSVIDALSNNSLENMTKDELQEILKSINKLYEKKSGKVTYVSGKTWLEIELLLSKTNLFRLELAPICIKRSLQLIRGLVSVSTDYYRLIKREVEKELIIKNKNQINIRRKDDFSKFYLMELESLKHEAGFIYLLSNNEESNVFKIGFTSKSVSERVKKINSTRKKGVLMLENYWKTIEPYIVEQRIHKALAQDRIKGEFFRGNRKAIEEVIEKEILI